jgi:CotH protein/lamin tail-like protein/Ig-like domain-containing protein/thrombospondin type 3 repeat protein
MLKSTAFFLAAILIFTIPMRAASPLIISEFMAANDNSISDNDGDKSDWIEIYNGGTNTVSLLGWYLTDTTNNLRKWQFPAVSLAPNGYLLVFASEKDRRNPEAPLHTNFRLNNDGEYLALIESNGTSVAFHFFPHYPIQAADVSYGYANDARDAILVNAGMLARALVPASDALGLTWTEASFGDASWLSGSTGVGYDRTPTPVDYNPLLGLNVEASMFNINQTVYIRIPFLVTNVAELDTLTLRMQYEDGMIAYLNGREIARDNAPSPATYNSGALANRADDIAVIPADFNVTSSRDFLFVGQNVLAIHGLNQAIGSSDLLVRPQLLARTRSTGLTAVRYFPTPTPGAANNDGVELLGPIVTQVRHTPNIPEDDQDIVVTARIRPAFAPVASAVLRYRVMYGAEVELPFLDDGLNGDGAAGDGVYGATIPASAATTGQMIRWFIRATDTSNVVTRVPTFAEPLRSPEYLGTMVAVQQTNNLEILHWFVQSPSAAETVNGTRASLFFLGEFYDNVGINRHGQSSGGFPKKSFDIDFHRGFNFRWALGERRVDDINLLTTYPDKARVRNMLAYEAFRDAGVPYHFVVPVRVHQNGVFWGDTHIVENGDDNYLQRLGLDPKGALYKMYNTLNVATGEKKTRKDEGTADLQALIDGALLPAGSGRNAFMFDNINVPECINYLAAQTITGNVDCCHKNYYLYRDTEGTGEWQILPWDIDLSYGRVWSTPTTYWDDFLYSTTGLRVGNNNTLMIAIYNTPEFLAMYQRRLRTLMEEILQPPGTPASQGKFEQRINELVALIGPDGALDLAKWGTWCCSGAGPYTQATIPNAASYQTMRDAADYMITNYFPARRNFLFSQAEIPAAMPANPVILPTAIEYSPASGNQLQEYIELRNTNAYAADISGWRLTGGIDFTFAPGTVMLPNSLLYVSPDVRAFRARTTAPRGGMGLFVQGPYQGQLSARGETVNVVDRFGRAVVSVPYLGNPSLAQKFLRITELMYHPSPVLGDPTSEEEFEYVELKNVGPVGLNLTGVRLTGVTFDFTGSAVTNLAPGAAVLVVKNLSAFNARYGTGLPVAGQYIGSLDNSGERIRLLDSVGEEILDFDYNNTWYPITDGLGFSLVVVDEQAHPDEWTRREHWRPSGNLLGSPGADDPPALNFAPVLVNEALTRTAVTMDAIELYNPNTNDVNVSGWYLTDDFADPFKFRIPDGTVIAAGGYRVFSEGQFNPNPGVAPSFALSSDGDEVYLFGTDTNGDLTGYVHGFAFGAAEEEVAFGRHVSSEGKEHFVAQSQVSLGGSNVGPSIGPMVISEIMYHPPDIGTNDNTIDEFIELRADENGVQLFDFMRPTNTWKITGGVDFTFPTNISLVANEAILLVSFAPTNASAVANFRSKYGVDSGVRIFGPYSGKLNNDTDQINLRKPTPPVTNDEGVVSIPYALVESVEYEDNAPWPKAADVLGYSLQRWDADAFANDPVNWVAPRPSAGAATIRIGTRPQFTEEPVGGHWIAGQTRMLTAAATGSPQPTFQWRLNGTNIPGATSASLEVANVQAHHAGDYEVVISNLVATVFSRPATIVVRFPVAILQQPQTVDVRVPPDPQAAPSTNATFSVDASSAVTVQHQWRRNGMDISGATSNRYTVVNVGTNDLGYYTCVVSDDISTLESAPAWLYPLVSPVFLEGPLPQSAVANSPVTLSAQVTGWPPPFTFELRLGAAIIATNVQNDFSTFFTVNAPSTGSASYRIAVKNRAFPSGRITGFAAITALVDSDGDGISDQWETAYGFNPTNAMDRLADADGDGLLNWQEFQAGTDPTNALSILKLDSLIWSNSTLRMQFQAMSNKTYAVQYNGALDTDNWQKLTGIVGRRTNRVEQVIDPAATNRFYRLITPSLP